MAPEIAKHLAEVATGPLRDLSRSLNEEMLSGLSAAAGRFEERSFARLGADIRMGGLGKWQEAALRIDEAVLAPIREAASRFQQSWVDNLKPLQQLLERLPGETRRAVSVLAEHGWYLDMAMPMPAPVALQELLEQGELERAEAWLVAHYNDRLKDIRAELEARFPLRGHILARGFDAHDRAEYELSIPVFLAQTDGICRELTGYQLFRKIDGFPQVAAYIGKLPADRFTTALLQPLTQVIPIWASERQRSPDSKQLNRHAVLHGESLDYGTETNSLKAVSLLQYVSGVLGRHDSAADATRHP